MVCKLSFKKRQLCTEGFLNSDRDKNRDKKKRWIWYFRLKSFKKYFFFSQITIYNINWLFRNINQPKNVKLLYDVLQYDPPAIKRAVLYATNNALVCETPEDASKVSFELGDTKRYDVSKSI